MVAINSIETSLILSLFPIHKAIDQASALMLEVRRLQRGGLAAEANELGWMEQVVIKLLVSLVECRERDRPSS